MNTLFVSSLAGLFLRAIGRVQIAESLTNIRTVFTHLEKYTTVKSMETIEFLMLYAAGERDFHNIDLASASLSYADLKGANLVRANLRHTNLRWADLRQTNLSWADLRGADLSWANLAGADLSHANLKGAKMPDGTVYE